MTQFHTLDLTVYRLSFSYMKRDQAGFLIYDVTFDALQNGKKIFEEKWCFQRDMGLGLLEK